MSHEYPEAFESVASATIEDLNQLVRSMERENRELKRKMEDYEEIQGERDRLADLYDKLKAQSQATEQSLRSYLKDAREAINDLTEKNHMLATMASDASHQSEESAAMIAGLQDDCEKLRSIASEWYGAFHVAKKELKEKGAEIQELKRLLDMKEMEKDCLRHNWKLVESQKEAETQRWQRSEDTILKLSNQIQRLEEDNRACIETRRGLERSLSARDQDIESLKIQIEALKAEPKPKDEVESLKGILKDSIHELNMTRAARDILLHALVMATDPRR